MHKPANKANTNDNDDSEVLLQLDRRTAAEIKRISVQTQLNPKKVTQLFVFLGQMMLGRKINIGEDKKVLSISLEQYPKVAPLLDSEDKK